MSDEITAVRAVALGDVNKDGALDLVVGNYDQTNRVFFGVWADADIDGFFDAGETWLGFTVGQDISADADNTRGIALKDVNADTNLDVIVANYGEVNKVYFGDGLGGFGAAVNVTADVYNSTCVAAANLDADGNMEIVFGNYGQVDRIYQWTGAAFAYQADVSADARNTQAIALADVDNDTDIDIVIGNVGASSRFYRNNGAGVFTAYNISTDVRTTYGIAVANVDGDAYLDIVTGNLNEKDRLYRSVPGAGWTGFTSGEDISNDALESHAIAFVDVNAANGPDVIVANAGSVSRIYMNTGSGAFQAGVNITGDTDNTRGIAVGDVNGDGNRDVVVANRNQATKLYLGNGAGGFGAGIDLLFVTGTNPGPPETPITELHQYDSRAIALADVNLDGALDIVVGNYGQALEVYWGDGSGGFITSRVINQETGEIEYIPSYASTETENTTCLVVADVNGDNVPDIVVGNENQVNRVYFGHFTDSNEDNVWNPGEKWTSLDASGAIIGNIASPDTDNTQAIAVGNIDEVNGLDIIVGNWNQENKYYLNNGDGTFASAVNLHADIRNTCAMAVADVDGDGHVDVVTGNSGAANRIYWGWDGGVAGVFLGADISADVSDTRAIRLGDIDGDTRLDVITANNLGTDRIYLKLPGRAFAAGVSISSDANASYALALGDMNNDTRVDMIIGNDGQVNRLYFNSGGAAFGSPHDLNTMVTIHAGRDFVRSIHLQSIGDFYNVSVDVGRDLGASVANGGVTDFGGDVLYAWRGGFVNTAIDIGRDLRASIHSRIDKTEIYDLHYNHPYSRVNNPAGVSRYSYGGFNGGASYVFSGTDVTDDSNVTMGGHITVNGDWTTTGDLQIDGHINSTIRVTGTAADRDGDFYGRIRTITSTDTGSWREPSGNILGTIDITGDFYDPDGVPEDNMSDSDWISGSRTDTLPGGQIYTYTGDLNGNIYIRGDFVSGRIGAGTYTTWSGGASSGTSPYYWTRDIGRDFLLDITGGMLDEAYLMAGYEIESYARGEVGATAHLWGAEVGMISANYLQEPAYNGPAGTSFRHYYADGATIVVRGSAGMAGTILCNNFWGILKVVGTGADMSGLVTAYDWMGNSDSDASAASFQRGAIFIRDGNLTGEVSGRQLGADIWVRDGDYAGPNTTLGIPKPDDGIDNGNIYGLIRAGHYIVSACDIFTSGPVWQEHDLFPAHATPAYRDILYYYTPNDGPTYEPRGGNFSGTVFANYYVDCNIRAGGSITEDALIVAGNDLQGNFRAGQLDVVGRAAEINGSFWAGRDFHDTIGMWFFGYPRTDGTNPSVWHQAGDIGDEFDLHVGRDFWGVIQADHGSVYGTIEVGRDFGGAVIAEYNWTGFSSMAGNIGHPNNPANATGPYPNVADYTADPTDPTLGGLGSGKTFLTVGRDFLACGDIQARVAIYDSIVVGRDYCGNVWAGQDSKSYNTKYVVWSEMGAGSAAGDGISDTTGSSRNVSIATGSDGNAIVAWEDNTSGDYEIYVRRWDGTSWVEVGTGSASGGGISDNAGSSLRPTITTNGAGDPVVAWYDDTSGDTEIYVRRFDGTSWVEVGAGSASGGGISNNAGSSQNPSIARDGSGNPAVAWYDNSGGNNEIYVRRWDGTSWVEMNASATGVGISNNAGSSVNPAITFNSAGNAVVAWHDNTGGDTEIYVRRFDGANWVEMVAGSATGGGISNNAGLSENPTITTYSDGNPIIAWHDSSGTDTEIYVLRWTGAAWTAMGSASGGGISNNAGSSLNASIARNAAGGNPTLAWYDDSGGGYDVYVRYWNGSSWVEAENASAQLSGISRNSGSSLNPAVTVDPAGNRVVAWYDNTGGDSEIYVSRSNGTRYIYTSGIFGDVTIGRDWFVDYLNLDEMDSDYQNNLSGYNYGAGTITAGRGSVGDPRYDPIKITIGRDFIGAGEQPTNPNEQGFIHGGVFACRGGWGNSSAKPIQVSDQGWVIADITVGRNMINGAYVEANVARADQNMPAMRGSLNVGYVYDDLGALVPYREAGAATGGLMDGIYYAHASQNDWRCGHIATDFLIAGSIGPNGVIKSLSGRLVGSLDVGADPDVGGSIQGEISFAYAMDQTFTYTENGVTKTMTFTGSTSEAEIVINGNPYRRSVEFIDLNGERQIVDLPENIWLDQSEDPVLRGDYVAFVGHSEATGYDDIYVYSISTGTLWNATNWAGTMAGVDRDSYGPMFAGLASDYIVFGTRTYHNDDFNESQQAVYAYQITGVGAGTVFDISEIAAVDHKDAFNFDADGNFVVYEWDNSHWYDSGDYMHKLYIYDLTTGAAGSPREIDDWWDREVQDRPFNAQISYSTATGQHYIVFQNIESQNAWAGNCDLYWTTTNNVIANVLSKRLSNTYTRWLEASIDGYYVVAVRAGNYSERGDIAFWDLRSATADGGNTPVFLSNNGYRGFRWGYGASQTSAVYGSYNPYISGDIVAFETDNYYNSGVREIEFVDLDPDRNGTPVTQPQVVLKQITFNDGLGEDTRGYSDRIPFRYGGAFPAVDSFDPVVAWNDNGTPGVRTDDTYHIVFETVHDCVHVPEDGVRDVMWYDVSNNWLTNLTENTGSYQSYNYYVAGDYLAFETHSGVIPGGRSTGTMGRHGSVEWVWNEVAGSGQFVQRTDNRELAVGDDSDGITDIYMMQFSVGAPSLTNLTNNRKADGRLDSRGSYDPYVTSGGMVVFETDHDEVEALDHGLVTVRPLANAGAVAIDAYDQVAGEGVDFKYIYLRPTWNIGNIEAKSIQGSVWADQFGNVTTLGDVNNLFHRSAAVDMTANLLIGGDLTGTISTPANRNINPAVGIAIGGDITSTGVIQAGSVGAYGYIASNELTVGGRNYGQLIFQCNQGGPLAGSWSYTDLAGSLAPQTRSITITKVGALATVTVDGTHGLGPSGTAPFDVALSGPVYTAADFVPATSVVQMLNAEYGLGNVTITGWAGDNVEVYEIVGTVTVTGGIPNGTLTIVGDIRPGGEINTSGADIVNGALRVGGAIDGQVIFSRTIGAGAESFTWYEDYMNQGGAPAANNLNAIQWTNDGATDIDFILGDGTGTRNSMGGEGVVDVTVTGGSGSLLILSSGNTLAGDDYVDFNDITMSAITGTLAGQGIQANSIVGTVSLGSFLANQIIQTGIFQPDGAGIVGGDLGNVSCELGLSGDILVGRDLVGWLKPPTGSGDIDGTITIGRNILPGAGIDPGAGNIASGVLTVAGIIDGQVIVPHRSGGDLNYQWSENGVSNEVDVADDAMALNTRLYIGTGDGQRSRLGDKGLVSLYVDGSAASLTTTSTTPIDFLDITATNGAHIGTIEIIDIANGTAATDGSVFGGIYMDLFTGSGSVEVGALGDFHVVYGDLLGTLRTYNTSIAGGASGDVTGTVQSQSGAGRIASYQGHQTVFIDGKVIGHGVFGGLVTTLFGYNDFDPSEPIYETFVYSENGDTETADLRTVLREIGPGNRERAVMRIGCFGTAGNDDGEGLVTIDARGYDLSDIIYSGVDLTGSDLILYDLIANDVTIAIGDQHEDGVIRIQNLLLGRIWSDRNIGSVYIEGTAGLLSNNGLEAGTSTEGGNIAGVYFTNNGSVLDGSILAHAGTVYDGDIGSVEFLMGNGAFYLSATPGGLTDTIYHSFSGSIVADGDIGYFKILDGWMGNNSTVFQTGFNGILQAGGSIGNIDVGSYVNRSVIGAGTRIYAGTSGNGGNIGDITVYSYSTSGDYTRGGGITAGPNETNPLKKAYAGVVISAAAGTDPEDEDFLPGDIGYITVMYGCITSEDNDDVTVPANVRYNVVEVYADGSLEGVFCHSQIQGFYYVGDEVAGAELPWPLPGPSRILGDGPGDTEEADSGTGVGGNLDRGFISWGSAMRPHVLDIRSGNTGTDADRAGDFSSMDLSGPVAGLFDYEVFDVMDVVNGKVSVSHLPRAVTALCTPYDFASGWQNGADLFKVEGTVRGDIIVGRLSGGLYYHWGAWNEATGQITGRPIEFGAFEGDILINGMGADMQSDLVIHSDYDGTILAMDHFYEGMWIRGDFGGRLITNPTQDVPHNGQQLTSYDQGSFMSGLYPRPSGLMRFDNNGLSIYGDMTRGSEIIAGGVGSIGMYWSDWGNNLHYSWGKINIDGDMDGVIRAGTRVNDYGGNLNAPLTIDGDVNGIIDIAGSITKAYYDTAAHHGYMEASIQVGGEIRSGALSVGSSRFTGGKGGVIMGPVTSHGHALDGDAFMYSEDGVGKTVVLRGTGANTADITIDGGHMIPIQFDDLDLTAAYRYVNQSSYNPEAFVYYYDDNWTVRDTGAYAICTSGGFETTRTQNVGANDLHAQVSVDLSSAAGLAANEGLVFRNADVGDVDLGATGDILGLLRVENADIVGSVWARNAAPFAFNTSGIDVEGVIGDIRRVGNRTLAAFSAGGIDLSGGSSSGTMFAYRNAWGIDRVNVTGAGVTMTGLSIDTLRTVDAPTTQLGVPPAPITISTVTGLGIVVSSLPSSASFTTSPGTQISGLTTASGPLAGTVLIDGTVVPGGLGITAANNYINSGVLTVTEPILGDVRTYLVSGTTFTYTENGEVCSVTANGITSAGNALFVISGQAGSAKGLGVGPYLDDGVLHAQASLGGYLIDTTTFGATITDVSNIEIYNGQLVYERGNRIYYWSGSGAPVAVSASGRTAHDPTIYGDYIAWEQLDSTNNDWDIWRYQISVGASSLTNISDSDSEFVGGNNAVNDINVDNYNNTFVWQRIDPVTKLAFPTLNEWDIIYYDGNAAFDVTVFTDDNGTFTPPGQKVVDDTNPTIHNGYVTWEHLHTNKGVDGAGNPIPDDWDIYLRHVTWSAGSTRNISDGTAGEDNLRNDLAPDNYDIRTVFHAFDGNDYEIFYYNGTVTTQMTNNNVDDRNPSLYNQDFAFVRGDYDDVGGTWVGGEIYLYEAATGKAGLVDLGALGDGQIDQAPDLYAGAVAWQRGATNRIAWRPPTVYLGTDTIVADNVNFAQIGNTGLAGGVEAREFHITNADVGTIFLGQFTINGQIHARDVYNITQSGDNDRYFIDGQIRVHRIGRDGVDGGTITVGRGGIGPLAIIEVETDIGTVYNADGTSTAGLYINNHGVEYYSAGRLELDNWQPDTYRWNGTSYDWERYGVRVYFQEGSKIVYGDIAHTQGTQDSDWAAPLGGETIGAGSVFAGPDGRFYEVFRVINNTQIELVEAYHGESVSTNRTRITTITGNADAVNQWTGNQDKIANRLIYFDYDWGYHRVKSVNTSSGILTPYTTSFTGSTGNNIGTTAGYNIGNRAQGIAYFNGDRGAIIKTRGLDGSNGDIGSIIFDDYANDLRGIVEAAGSIGNIWVQDSGYYHEFYGTVTAKGGSIGNVQVTDATLQGRWTAAEDIGWVMLYGSNGFAGTSTVWTAGRDFGGIYLFDAYDNSDGTIVAGRDIGNIYAPRMGGSSADFNTNLLAGRNIGNIHLADGRIGFEGGTTSYVHPREVRIEAGRSATEVGNIGYIYLGTYYGVLNNTAFEQTTDACFGISESGIIRTDGNIGNIDISGNMDGEITAGGTIGSGGVGNQAIVLRGFEEAASDTTGAAWASGNLRGRIVAGGAMLGDVVIGGSVNPIVDPVNDGWLEAALFGNILIGDLRNFQYGDFNGTITTHSGGNGIVEIAGFDNGFVFPNRIVPGTWADWIEHQFIP